MGPLAGIRVLDLTSVLMGPYATLQLGDMGADVVKIEAPEGDIVRQIGPGHTPGMGGMFLHANRSKRSVAIDLKHPEGRKALLKLAETADVFVVNMRPKALARLELDYARLKAVQPRIIFVGLVGFGQTGPYADRPAYDDLIQGAAGVPALMAEASDGTPRYVPINIADRIVGLFAAQAILGALYYRERTGEGQAIEIPMFETMTGFVLGDHFGGLTYRPALDGGGYARLMSRYRHPYATKDGYICVLVYTSKQWASFFSAIGRPEAMNDPRFASHTSRTRNIDGIYDEIGSVFLERTTREWFELLEAADIPHMPMHTLATIQDDPHLKAVNFFHDVQHPLEGAVIAMRVASQWSRSHPEAGHHAPAVGEHSREVLTEAGFSETQIEQLLESAAIRQYI
jgi:crotonobetainyl-CoA:carnitine CoA-transferase CaiB-like acyl-CoA transferase